MHKNNNIFIMYYMNKKKIIIVGSKGKMGSQVVQVLKNDYLIIEIDKNDDMAKFEADLVIDFASAESSENSAKYCYRKKVPLIVGATGQSEKQREIIFQVSEVAPVLMAENFSAGMIAVKKCIKEILSLDDVSDVCIFEKHHKNKKDAPSGTALDLKRFINKQGFCDVQIISERGGEEIGTHMIDFYFGSEVISIKHQAFSRKAFACGVKIAVDFLIESKVNKKFEFDEIINAKID